jgi:hypothetical protein
MPYFFFALVHDKAVGITQPLDCSLHPDRRVLHLRQYILHPVYILYIPGVLRVWGWYLRHSGGAPVRVVSAVSRPGGAREGARGSAKTPACIWWIVALAPHCACLQGQSLRFTHHDII